ncbi:hypothetical protein GCM10023322_15470 [Rugosimonospora acidiphila]|uniref:Uncharacterized protein n=1 Tax=Rugosimonospora acidiphila TaxID=556531 RepID=A0ABP9RME9_9ACTN
MALVRRSALLGLPGYAGESSVDEGPSAVGTLEHPSTHSVGAEPTVRLPANGGAQAALPLPSLAAGRAPTATAGRASTTAWAADAEAAAVASKGASIGSIFGAFVFAAIGTAAGYVVHRWGSHVEPFEIGNQVSAYAAIIVFAGAVERLLEPFSNLLPGARARAEYESTVAALTNLDPAITLKDVAAARARLDRALANRAVLMWGLATGVAALVSAAGGFYLLHMIAEKGWVSQIPTWVDALITGLVVGTGTKPLHDLISRVQAAKGE